jgi:hypothetical protein
VVYDLWTYLWAGGIAVGLTCAYLRLCAWSARALERRTFREMANCPCPACGQPLGFEAVQRGWDCSPWEELWSDGVNHLIHCHPVMREVGCVRCGQQCVVRLNRQGAFFGPRLSAGKGAAAEPGAPPKPSRR